MPKHNQSARLGSVSDFTEQVRIPEPVSIQEHFESRLDNLEKSVKIIFEMLTDIQEQIDKPFEQPKSKASTKKKGTANKTAPSEIILAALKKNPLSRAEIEQTTDLTLDQINKCFGYLVKKKLVVKDKNDKDSEGNSRWKGKASK